MSSDLEYVRERFGWAGVLATAQAELSGTTPLFEVRHPGVRHPFHLRLRTSDLPTYDQIFVHQEYDFRTTEPLRTIVDAGANIGLTSIFLANRYPDARIVAIEPEASNFELLKKNVAPYPNVVPVNAALWCRNEPVNVVDPGLDKWGFMTVEGASAGDSAAPRCHAVDGLTVDRIMDLHGFTRIDLLKVDIEGAEKEVFEDTSRWIDRVDAVILELHDRMKSGCSRSFYNGTNGFQDEWEHGENVFLARHQRIRRA